jgi:NAD(P)-dependent dehydrogenase (short-subunit alcohol dehydrogenase family)
VSRKDGNRHQLAQVEGAPNLPEEEPDARGVVALVREAGRKAVSLPGDIRTEAVCQSLVAQAARELGGLDILVEMAPVYVLLASSEATDVTGQVFGASGGRGVP